MNIRALRFYRAVTAISILTGICAIGGIVERIAVRAQAAALCDNLWSSTEVGDNISVKDALEKGADPNCQCGEPMKRAKRSNHQDTAELLKRYGAKE